MITVNTKTLETKRIALPKSVSGLSGKTLRHLQQELKPVPEHLKDLEFWPEENNDTHIDPATHKYGNEILVADQNTKTVLVSHEIIPLTPEELADLAAKQQRKVDAENAMIAKEQAIMAIKQDALFGKITAQQASDYIENNVTDLASAKAALKKIAKFIIYIRDRG